ncbi:BTAD domain-containing putative transcriptional regulator [Streptomyces sp. ACA25]|uniref:AfsR/SARP family transcriptional regulator n=1 Tax=Streptomyces sp. ACA25 TaxID=3022596 RepID=UPI0023078DF9|nr:AfsR/SARP family transcriptional regulator [Streptomyces sp. ACA25]MDB1088698.1 BTAD domain-containing putative transcriptional regulator [Streptomyces sp. ACA25]
MDIRLLGPLQVRVDDGSPVPVTAPMLRATLAALALRPGQVLSVDELSEQLWGTAPPPSARATLRNYVMRLRKVIGGDRLRTESGGYQLALDRAETDVGRFQRELARARELSRAAPGEAVALLDAAMSLWRGTPLADLSDCMLRTLEQPRLEELYLAAQEERFALKLRLGEDAAVVDELSAAARAHPLRERFTGQLMLALHRGGRTAEALNAYRETRRRLVDELGIEPGHELRELHQAVLRGDPRPASPPADPPQSQNKHPATTAAAGPPASPDFPPGIATFVARGVELARLREWLSCSAQAPAVCLIDGPGGVGKSALAVRAAREAAHRFPDGLLYLDLRGADPDDGPLTVTEALHRLLPALGSRTEIPQETEAAAALYHRALRSRRMLVLLDNALDEAQAGPLIPSEPGCAALITSRSALTRMEGGRHLHLSTLTTSDAVALVRNVAGGSAEHGAHQDWEELVTLCGHLPLALRIIATRMAARPRWNVSDWTAVLRDERGRIAELATADLDVRASLLVSIDQLKRSGDPADRRAAAVFPLLGIAAVRSYSPASAAAVTGCTRQEAAEALERLTDAQITASPRPGVHTLHDLVRAAAVHEAAQLSDSRTRNHLAGLAGWYLGSLHRVNTPLALPESFRARYRAGAGRFPQGRLFTSADESLPWADEALEDVLALAGRLAAPEYDEGDELGGGPLSSFALESARAMESYFGMRLSWGAQQQLCDLALQVAERRSDVHGQAVVLGQLGKVCGQRGEQAVGAQLLQRSVALFRSLGEDLEAVTAMNNLIPCLGSSGRLTEAVELAERALDLLLRTAPSGMEELRISLQNNLARCHVHLGHQEEAHRLLTASYAEASLPYTRTLAAGLLAEYHLRTGEFEKAAGWADRGLGHAAEQPFDPYSVAQQRTWLAAALRGLGREERARAEEMQAQAVIEALNAREHLHLRVQADDLTAVPRPRTEA